MDNCLSLIKIIHFITPFIVLLFESKLNWGELYNFYLIVTYPEREHQVCILYYIIDMMYYSDYSSSKSFRAHDLILIESQKRCNDFLK